LSNSTLGETNGRTKEQKTGPRKSIFISEILTGKSGAQAARSAGVEKKNASRQAHHWQKEPEVAEKIEKGLTAIREGAAVTCETMIASLAEDHDLSIAHEAVQATLDAVPIADRAGFEAGFDGLPPGAQKAIIGELAQPGREWETLADEDELENFSSTPEGAELVSLWGDDADVNLGRVQARLSRIEANTSPAAIETLWDWFDNLPSAQAKAVLQELAR
jgi:hypothetical protein